MIAATSLAAYWNSFAGPFVFDDIGTIRYNAAIRHLWTLNDVLFPAFQDSSSVLDRPLVNLTFLLNYEMSGPDVWSYHLVNLLIHITCGLVLMGIVRRTFLQPVLRAGFGPAALPLALMIAVLWVVHPLQTESVTYITQRCESLMALFYFLTLYALIRATEAGGKSYWLLVSVAACFLGAASKEVIFSAPLVVLLYDRTFIAGTFGKALRERKKYYLGLVCSWPFLFWMLKRAGLVDVVQWQRPEPYLLTQIHAVVHYISLALWPYPQVIDYGPPTMEDSSHLIMEAVILLILGVGTLFALRQVPTAAKSWPVLGFLGGCFFLILATTSSFVPTRDAMVEHRMYLPLAAIIALAVSGCYRRLAWRGMVPFLLVIPVWMTLTILRNQDYQSPLVLWGDTVAKRPLNGRAQENLALALMAAGRAAEALEHAEAGIRINPGDSMAHNNLGGILRHLGRIAEAREQYQLALEIDPRNAKAHTNQGILLAQEGKYPEASLEFQEAISCNPQDIEAYVSLGKILTGMGRFDEAMQKYEDALKIDPDYVPAQKGLAWLRQEQGVR